MVEGEQQEGKRGRWWGLVRLILALTILGLIAQALPWDDKLTWTNADRESASAPGEIEGDWKEDRILFLLHEPAELPDGWPADARGPGPFEVTRKNAGEPGFDWEAGMPRVFASIERTQLLLGFFLFMVASMFAVTRWWRLLSLVGCKTTWFGALRLTYVGLCFNLVMPGLTGGDLVKGVIVARENPGRRADAVASVVVDRLIGLAALAILAVVVVLVSGAPFDVLRTPLLLLIGAAAVGCGLYAAKPLRRMLGLSWLVDRLPLGDKLRDLDAAALLYLRHPMQLVLAFALSFANHIVVCIATFVLGIALGIDPAVVGLRDFLVLAPVANMISAIPIAPGGWGVGELAYRDLFALVGVPAALGVAVSVTFRLCNQIGLGVLGSLFLLLPGVRAEVREIEPARKEA